MKNTKRAFTILGLAGAALTLSGTAHATDVLNLVNVKRVPVSVLSSGAATADNIPIVGGPVSAAARAVDLELGSLLGVGS